MTELNLILYLHILFAMLLVGGIVAHWLVYMRGRKAEDGAVLRATVRDLRAIERLRSRGPAGIVGLRGLLLAWRYDAKGILNFGEETWLHVSTVLWLVANAVAGLESRSLRRAVEAGGSGGNNTGAIRGALNSSRYLTLAAINAVVVLVILYLMVFQP